MSVVAMGMRPSLHAAAKACKDLPVSVQAVYDKIKRTEPALVRALVQGSARQLAPVLSPIRQGQSPTARGYRLRIVDGNHLPASQKRLKPLRGFRGAGFIVREYGASPNPRTLGKPCRAGRIETGMVHEQKVSIEDETGQPLMLRRIELDLDEPTEDGESVIVLLTNLSKSQFTARKIARVYRRRWHMENLLQRLESVLYSEVSSLGHPPTRGAVGVRRGSHGR